MEPFGYLEVPSRWGPASLVWQDTSAGPRVQQVFLPCEPALLRARIGAAFQARSRACPEMADLAERLGRFLAGEAVALPLERVALERCPPFQQQVLLAEYAIPRGWVSTYGRIAAHLGRPGAARAVGQALARNPFPILIPCHRAIAASGRLGGYQGGPALKRALLAMEGVEFTADGRVVLKRVYYGCNPGTCQDGTALL